MVRRAYDKTQANGDDHFLEDSPGRWVRNSNVWGDSLEAAKAEGVGESETLMHRNRSCEREQKQSTTKTESRESKAQTAMKADLQGSALSLKSVDNIE